MRQATLGNEIVIKLNVVILIMIYHMKYYSGFDDFHGNYFTQNKRRQLEKMINPLNYLACPFVTCVVLLVCSGTSATVTSLFSSSLFSFFNISTPSLELLP